MQHGDDLHRVVGVDGVDAGSGFRIASIGVERAKPRGALGEIVARDLAARLDAGRVEGLVVVECAADYLRRGHDTPRRDADPEHRPVAVRLCFGNEVGIPARVRQLVQRSPRDFAAQGVPDAHTPQRHPIGPAPASRNDLDARDRTPGKRAEIRRRMQVRQRLGRRSRVPIRVRVRAGGVCRAEGGAQHRNEDEPPGAGSLEAHPGFFIITMTALT